ncbi:hypothetical protein [Pseudoalteromonas ruthenica]|uniref:hypothetical protein n=1 Tax=Pseudoalteromonas ruthenica TaxID=151081 RepID=UPI0012441A9D|nr:hypothetical protein [Pseudoalteromonas ruthenica]
MKRTLLLALILLLTACGQNDDDITGDPNSPGYVATQYFYALYNHDNLERATQYATPKLARIMRSYGTASQFTRNLVNLQYDQVTIELDRTEMSVRQQYGDHATINLVFTGHFHGNQVDDMRSVKMIRERGDWLVSEIVPDPYGR